MSKGIIHSIESMGLVDGPGIRTVVFLQGCYLRCRYCHNPDTWSTADEKSRLVTPEELVAQLERYRPYYGRRGGVTFSGGEPLLQPEFLAEALELCRGRGINTCLDTAGCGKGGYERILRSTDLVLLDVKHCTPEGFRLVTGHGMDEFLDFLGEVQRLGVPLWIRHVVVPGLTDSDEHLGSLESFISGISGVERVELLPYHTLGVHKYRELGIPYSLDGVPPAEEECLREWNMRLNEAAAGHERRSQ